MPWRKILSRRLSKPAAAVLEGLSDSEASLLEEIRIRTGCRLALCFGAERREMGACFGEKEMADLLAALCGYARYAYEQQMAEGYIPLPGGHRAGICGRMTRCEGGALRMSEVTSVCIRIARPVHGASRPVQRYLVDKSGIPLRVLMLGPPGCGKTTILRDAALYLAQHCRLNVLAVDERSELFPMAQKSGVCLDVLSGISKARGLQLMIRTMAPQIVVVDEIGSEEDAAALLDAARCGVGVLASAHGRSFQDILQRPMLRRMLDLAVFDRYLLLGRHGACISAWNELGHACNGEGSV